MLRGGLVITADGRRAADVLIRDGRIAEVAPGLETHGQVLDVSGHWVMPGGIDTHTHLAHPIDRLGVTTADDFHVGTVAAACGGVTTILDFGLQRRGERLTDARDRRMREIEPDAVIDYGFHMIVTDVRSEVLNEIPAMIDSGFPSFKIYMTYGDKKVDDHALLQVLLATAKHGGIVYAHCENDCAVTHLIQRHLDAGLTGPAYHAPSRPPAVEAEATNRAIMLAEVAGSPICIAHVTSSGAAEHVEAARTRGAAVVAETCPQYLVLTDDVYDPDGGFEVAKYVCSPPMRGHGHAQDLWRRLVVGGIQQVSSDHAPFRFRDQKTKGRRDFTRIPNGLPGIETRLPLVFTRVDRADGITAEQFVALTSTNPARIFGLYPTKGSLQPGADADLVVVDPERETVIDWERLHSAVDYSPFQGMRVRGFPTWTLSRGEIVVREGEPQARRGRGRLVRRSRIGPGDLP